MTNLIKKWIARMYGYKILKCTKNRQILLLIGSSFRFARIGDNFLSLPSGLINVTNSNIADFTNEIKQGSNSFSYFDCEVYIRG